MSLEEDFTILDRKVMQLKLDYERYFLGSRPREPLQLRSEVQRAIALHSNMPIQNTALRFKFSSTCSRFYAFKRQWAETLRKIDDGSYTRHQFKAELRQKAQTEVKETPTVTASAPDEALFADYVAARESCGQAVKNLTPSKLEAVLSRQRDALKERFGDAKFRFRVVVEDGAAKLKASRVR